MAKKKARAKKARPTKKASSRGASKTSLESRLKQLDHSLLKTLNQRARLSLQIGKIRKTSHQPASTPGKEEDQLSRVVGLNRGPLTDRCVRAVFRELVSGCRSLVKDLRIAFLGPEYSYSHLAAIHRFGQSVQFAGIQLNPGVRRQSESQLEAVELTLVGLLCGHPLIAGP